MTPKTRADAPLPIGWRFLASMQLTIFLLLVLAATSVIGTLIPQGGEPGDYIRAYGNFGYRLLHVLDLFDMYHSWWFQTLIALLTVNIVVCTLKRFPAVWKILFTAKAEIPGPKPGQKYSAEFHDSRDPNDLKSIYDGYIRKRFPHYHIESNENGFGVVAEKGRWTRLGVTVVHLSVVLLLVGALVGSQFGFDGYVTIPEGESTDRIRLRNSDAVIPLGFEIRCDDFDVTFYDSGAPKEYRSSLRILENGQTVVEKDIIVNDPLRHKGINLFQSSYGPMPPRDVRLRFEDRDSGEMFQHKMSIGQRMEIPEAGLTVHLKEIRSDYQLNDKNVGETVLGVLERSGAAPIHFILPVRFPSYDKTRNDRWIVSVEDHEHMYYTGLQVTYDPGVPLVYAGFVLLILGCFVTFFMTHQKIAIKVAKSSHSSQIRIYGNSHRNPIGDMNRIQRIAAELGELK